MYENTEVNVKLTLGNIPLTIAQDAPQFGYPTQSLDPNNLSNGQFPTNSAQPLGFIENAPVPGFAQQVPPYGAQPFTSPYPQQPSLYPQPQVNGQSQLPYPDVNIQQPAFNPSFNNLNPGLTPSAPSF